MTGITRDHPMFSDDDIIELARSVEPHDFERIDPPPQVWNNVLAELEVAVASEEASARRRSQQQWFRSPRLLSMAAALVILAGIGIFALSNRGDDNVREVVAAAEMTDEGLPVGTDEAAQARVVCDDDGCSVEVDLSGLPQATDADLELWVINSDVSDMHSLGLVTESGSFDLPFGISPSEFPIVDISIEPRDGVEAHSGQSVLRGVFEQI